jgi:hypothetical protein
VCFRNHLDSPGGITQGVRPVVAKMNHFESPSQSRRSHAIALRPAAIDPQSPKKARPEASSGAGLHTGGPGAALTGDRRFLRTISRLRRTRDLRVSLDLLEGPGRRRLVLRYEPERSSRWSSLAGYGHKAPLPRWRCARMRAVDVCRFARPANGAAFGNVPAGEP